MIESFGSDGTEKDNEVSPEIINEDDNSSENNIAKQDVEKTPPESANTEVVEKEKQVVKDPANELSKILTGVDMHENPVQLMNVLFRDRVEIFNKYGIKPPEQIKKEDEYDSYYTYLIGLLANNGVIFNRISREELPVDFPSNLRAFVTHQDEMFLIEDDMKGVGEAEKMIRENVDSMSILHELIHILQNKAGTNLPPERKEYEAYVVANFADNVFLANGIIQEGTSNDDRVKKICSLATSTTMQSILGSSLISYLNSGVTLKDISFMYK
ncbi:MAG: hypothetical protein ACOX6Q_00625 [Candidatus Dojkabacteria bacterium]|jgi:hypothetical protein